VLLLPLSDSAVKWWLLVNGTAAERRLWLTFVSDASGQGSGFRLQFTAVPTTGRTKSKRKNRRRASRRRQTDRKNVDNVTPTEKNATTTTTTRTTGRMKTKSGRKSRRQRRKQKTTTLQTFWRVPESIELLPMCTRFRPYVDQRDVGSLELANVVFFVTFAEEKRLFFYSFSHI